MFKSIMEYNQDNHQGYIECNNNEKAVLITLVIFVLYLGISPDFLFNLLDESVNFQRKYKTIYYRMQKKFPLVSLQESKSIPSKMICYHNSQTMQKLLSIN